MIIFNLKDIIFYYICKLKITKGMDGVLKTVVFIFISMVFFNLNSYSLFAEVAYFSPTMRHEIPGVSPLTLQIKVKAIEIFTNSKNYK